MLNRKQFWSQAFQIKWIWSLFAFESLLFLSVVDICSFHYVPLVFSRVLGAGKGFESICFLYGRFNMWMTAKV